MSKRRKKQADKPVDLQTIRRSIPSIYNLGNGNLDSARSEVVVNEYTVLNLSAFWRGINILANDIVKLPLEVFRHLEDGKGKKPQFSHRIYRLLTYPNLYQTGRKLRLTAMVHLILFGNSVIEIIRDQDTGEPLSLELLDPRIVKPFRQSNNRLVYKFTHGHSPYSGNSVLLAENVLHFSGLSLNGDLGLSGVQACSDSLGLSLSVEQFARSLFDNAAVPSGVVEVPVGWDEIARINFRESFESNHIGSSGWNKTAILEEGAKFVATSFDPEKLQLISIREFTVLEVGRILGLPPSKLGDFSHEVSRSLSESNRDYYETSLLPLCVGIEDELGLKLFNDEERSEFFVKHNMDSLMRADDLTRAQTNEIKMRNGVLTWNEWRAEDGRNPFEKDGRVLPLNMEKVDDNDLDIDPDDDDPVATPAPGVQETARMIAREAIDKVVRREAKNLQRHTKDGKIDRDWVEVYYSKESPVWLDSLQQPLSLVATVCRSQAKPEDIVNYMIDRSKQTVLQSENIESLIESWGSTKADEILKIMEEHVKSD